MVYTRLDCVASFNLTMGAENKAPQATSSRALCAAMEVFTQISAAIRPGSPEVEGCWEGLVGCSDNGRHAINRAHGAILVPVEVFYSRTKRD